MNDFLQSLRSNHAEKQRSPMTRRLYDEGYSTPNQNVYSGTGYQNNSNPYMNRASSPQRNQDRYLTPEEDVSMLRLQDAVQGLNTHLEFFAQSQKNLIYVQEKAADMLERQVIAIERILDHLNISTD
ncbi:MAG: hypothetical protein KKE44_10685 [Proteobacteria bacterium]|nr:hypothetical protein [Pseudomonadota bacterium]MBU1583189.1 hypothetical protein [Pseudomonadota bacterium]MBU2629772.1 hypothetical protein [Pseudomonadota bacterium]